MATNEHLRDADRLSLPVPEGTVSGDPVLVGALVGVAQTSRGEGGNASTHATVWRAGSHHLTVTGAVDVGDPVYITAAGALTFDVTGNTLFGYALESKGAGDAVIPVALAKV